MKAAHRSSKINIVKSPESASISRSLTTFTMAVSVYAMDGNQTDRTKHMHRKYLKEGENLFKRHSVRITLE